MSKISTRDLASLVDKNFGSIYNTTGGGKKQYGGVNVKGFLQGILGNRVLDIYLKYLGIKTLTTASLVPFGLILGKDMAEKLLVQTGGGMLSVKIPFIDHPLIGGYLKLAGISALNLTTSTLVPIGILIIIHHLYNSKQLGGSKGQKGGSRTVFQSSIPPNIVQRIDNMIRGQPIYSPPANSNLACQNNSCGVNTYSSHFKPVTRSITAPGFPEYNIGSKTIPVGWSGTVNAINHSEIPHRMAGGSLQPNELRQSHNLPKGVPTSQYGGYTNNEISSHYLEKMKNNRKNVVNMLINKWKKIDKHSITNETSRSIRKMSNDNRYSNKSVIRLFPKSVLYEGLY